MQSRYIKLASDFEQHREDSRQTILQQTEQIEQQELIIIDQTAELERQAEQLTNLTSRLTLVLDQNVESSLKLAQAMRLKANADQNVAAARTDAAAAQSAIVEIEAARLVEDALGHCC